MSGRTAGPCERREAGFSLMEVIVALALLSMIMALLAGAIKGARDVVGFIERSAAASAVVPAQTYLRSVLAKAAPVAPGLMGDATSLRVRTFHALRGQLEGLYQIEIALEPVAGRPSVSDLVAIQSPVRAAAPDGSAADVASLKFRLLANVQSVAFSYFGASDEAPDQLTWLAEWTARSGLPRLVRVEVTMAPGQPQVWRQLDFPIQLAE